MRACACVCARCVHTLSPRVQCEQCDQCEHRRAGTEASSEKLVKGTGTGTVKAFDQAVLTISMAAAAARDKMLVVLW